MNHCHLRRNNTKKPRKWLFQLYFFNRMDIKHELVTKHYWITKYTIILKLDGSNSNLFIKFSSSEDLSSLIFFQGFNPIHDMRDVCHIVRSLMNTHIIFGADNMSTGCYDTRPD